MSSALVGSKRQQLSIELASILPKEGSQHFVNLNEIRFLHRAHKDQTFLNPASLIELLAQAVEHRGHLRGDDRMMMQMQGSPAEAFDLPQDRYSYLRVPAEGRVGMMPINELPEWVPVAIETESCTQGLSVSHSTSGRPQLFFSVDSDFQRLVNYATIVIAPNWFENPSTSRCLLDVVIGPPPYGQNSIDADCKAVKKAGLKPGQQITVGELKKISSGANLMLGCHLKNLPGSH